VQTPAVKWYTYAQAVALAKKSPRPIFVDVYTDWCGWCKVMDKNTFNHPEISSYLNKKFYPVKLNAESSEMTLYQGQALTNAQLAASIFKVSSYPTTVYLEADERVLQPLPGYLNPNQFNPIIHFIGDGNYKTTTWEEFQVNFKDTIQ
jgi:thioredoxin-related protein